MKNPVLIILLCVQFASGNGTYRFFRDMDKKPFGGTRRIFGGEVANIEEFPGTCLLTDTFLKPKCTGTIITPNFLITAAHCITPNLHFVLYNTRNPKYNNDKAEITHVFQHPGFSFQILDEGRGEDVTQLYHDVGLAKTEQAMLLAFPTRRFMDLPAIRSAGANVLYGDVKILGFGRTSDPNAEELLKVYLRATKCDRNTWLYCACGQPMTGQRSRGVCTGDSGGPVVFNNTLVGVTSMGPLECSASNDPNAGATSVFTLVARYLDIINDTIYQKAGSEKMSELPLNQASTYQTYSQGGYSIAVSKNAVIFFYLWLVNTLLIVHF